MKKLPIKTVFLALFALVILIILADGFYVIREPDQVVITQFGDPIGSPHNTPGLYMKIPFTQKINRFEKRYLEWDGDPSQVPTKDKKFIFVDYYARWEITDPLLFFKRVRNESGAQTRIDDILDGETRSAIANHDLLELVRTSNRTPQSQTDLIEIIEDSLNSIKVGRNIIQRQIQSNANERGKDLGISILDFRFKRIKYVQEVQNRVYDRMISERNRIADKFRSEGQGEASRINGEKQRELKAIQSEAFRKAEEIRGRADADAAAIYTKAYNQSVESRELYKFLKTLESYHQSLSSNTTLILSADSELFELFKSNTTKENK